MVACGNSRKISSARPSEKKSMEVMISLLSVESQQAITERLNRALEAVGKS